MICYLPEGVSALLEKPVFTRSHRTLHHIAEIRAQKCDGGVAEAETSQPGQRKGISQIDRADQTLES